MPSEEKRRYAQVSFRPGSLLERLQERADNLDDSERDGMISQIARRDLERYYSLLRQSLPTFVLPEASLIVDVLNGTLTMPETARLLWAEIDDAVRVDHLHEKWGVADPEELVARLRSLTAFEALAIADAAERFWAGPYRRDDLDTAGQLRAVGLVQGD